ncbi:metal ABC transporter ATPase [Burkholderia ambifaria]|uniref:metal ABC transporter ATPase n=1 Tax=Burkholderia ambifaria TaxID=152480 RepID=UPI000F803904|nr:metal ABC transporter ATPase [Burkholderia ambifaria]
MGVGMQIVCVGFTGYAALEAEAGAQLVRLERFRARLADCRLTIESRTSDDGDRTYDVRLELLMHDRAPASLPSSTGDDVNDTMRRAFAHAEQALSVWHADESEAAVALRQVKTGAAAQ